MKLFTKKQKRDHDITECALAAVWVLPDTEPPVWGTASRSIPVDLDLRAGRGSGVIVGDFYASKESETFDVTVDANAWGVFQGDDLLVWWRCVIKAGDSLTVTGLIPWNENRN